MATLAKVEEIMMEKTCRDHWISDDDVLSFCDSLQCDLKWKNMLEQLKWGCFWSDIGCHGWHTWIQWIVKYLGQTRSLRGRLFLNYDGFWDSDDQESEGIEDDQAEKAGGAGGGQALARGRGGRGQLAINIPNTPLARFHNKVFTIVFLEGLVKAKCMYFSKL